MTKADNVRKLLNEQWIPAIYEQKVRRRRTRAVQLPVAMKLNSAEILFTLLGIELKIGRRRIPCPDLATARYLQVFARLGCAAVAVPYDITQISPLADELEVAWQRLILLIESVEKDRSKRARLRSSLIRQIRDAVDAAGAGGAVPEFRQSTRQREN